MPAAIRSATLADTGDLAAIYRVSEGAVRAELGAGHVEAVDLASWFAARLSGEEASIAFVAPEAGFIELAADGELVALYVVPAAWGAGVAGALHDRAIEYLRLRGAASSRLVVIARNARARRFYERRGWRCAGDDMPREIGGIVLAFVRYELAL